MPSKLVDIEIMKIKKHNAIPRTLEFMTYYTLASNKRLLGLFDIQHGVLQSFLHNILLLLLGLLLLNIILLAVKHKLRSNYCKPNY